MTLTAVTLFWILFGSAVAQGALVCGFVIALRRTPRVMIADADCPKAAIVLCLRGTDPFLPDCIDALLNQDYPQFEIHVVVDCMEDPAWAVVEEILQRRRATNLHVQPLVERRDTCSLKCSSVVQAIMELDSSYEIVALVDADTLAHRTWLRELAAPLADPQVGASTGNRWYMPQQSSWGELVRYLWNAAAVVQMYTYGIAWGGTLALRLKTLRETDLLERWSSAFCEDTMLFAVLRKQGLRVAFVPSLMMINREGCDMPGFFHWVRRQLLTARLYHPGWLAVAAHGLSTTILLAAGYGILTIALVTGRWDVVMTTAAGLALYQVSMLAFIAAMELAIRRIAKHRGESTKWLDPWKALKVGLALFVTQTVYAAALVSAILVRRVTWRGIAYQIDGPWKIRLLKYEPYAAPIAEPDSLASL